MKYINYSTIVFALLLGSCSQQRQITKTPNHQPNTVATTSVIDTVKVVAIPKQDYGDTYTIDPRGYYEDAYEHLQEMFNGQQPLNFKKAVFITENAWFQNQLSYDEYNNYINALASVCKAWDKANPLLNYKWDFDSTQVALNGAVYHVMTDTVKDGKGNIVSTPYHYDFSDCFAKDNWTGMFVTKLMLTHGGNCHSLPFLYKILSEELGTKAYLSMLPEHIYINQYARKTSWYNTELTGRCFPVDAWLMSTGYVSVQSIRTRLYMDTLSLKESVAICVNDLAKGYERKFGDGDYKFILKCCDLGLTYYPTYGELLLLKAETLKKLYQSKIAEYGLNAPDSKEHGEEIHSIYDKMEQTYNRLAKLDYREIPEALYSRWTDAMINGGKAENENIHDTIVTTNVVTPFGKKMDIIAVCDGNYVELFENDTLRRIGSVMFNNRKHKVEYFILGDDEKYSTELTRPEEPARFLSIDPMASKFPDYSPYMYAGDKPIRAVDMDGQEDMIIWSGVAGAATSNVFVQTSTTVKGDADYESTKATLSSYIDFSKVPQTGVLAVQTVQNDVGEEYASIHTQWTPAVTVYGDPSLGNKVESTLESLDNRYYGDKGLRQLGNDATHASSYVKAVGLATSLVAPEVGIPIYEAGSYLGDVGQGANMIEDYHQGNYKDFGVRAGAVLINQVVTNQANKLSDANRALGVKGGTDIATEHAQNAILGNQGTIGGSQQGGGSLTTGLKNTGGSTNYPAYPATGADATGNASFSTSPADTK